MSFIWFLIIGGSYRLARRPYFRKRHSRRNHRQYYRWYRRCLDWWHAAWRMGSTSIGLLHLACVARCDHPRVYCEPDHEIDA